MKNNFNKKGLIILLFLMANIGLNTQVAKADKNIETDVEKISISDNESITYEETDDEKFEVEELEDEELEEEVLENEGWKEKDGIKYYFLDGQAVMGWNDIDGERYYFNENGEMVTGWHQEVDGSWYYLNLTGEMVTDWLDINGTWYYLLKDGRMVTNTYRIENRSHVFTSSGRWLGSWRENNTGWWFSQADKNYPTNRWLKLDHKWYHFNQSGYMNTGWIRLDGKWYYLNLGGSMASGWKKVNNNWYYLSSSGQMQLNWKKINNSWYYLKSSGAMATGSYKIKGTTHAFTAQGRWQGSWHKNRFGWWFKYKDNTYPKNKWARLNNNWYYFDKAGYMKTGWQKINHNWYYLNSGGSMATGWKKIRGDWYYLNPNGSMAVGWKRIKGSWYYLFPTGKMAKNTKVGKYTIGNNGVWRGLTVYIDPGHGGLDSGASYFKLKEKVLNLNTSLLLKQELEYRGYDVIMSRSTDIFIKLGNRPLDANKNAADIFVSVHYNSSGGSGKYRGIETYIHHTVASGFGEEVDRNKFKTNDPRIKNSLRLADFVQSRLISNTGMYNRGVKGNNFNVLRNTKMPAILVELGFMDNKSESLVIKNSSYHKKAAVGIANGIDKYFE